MPPTGASIAVWLRDIEHLYRFVTDDPADLDVGNVDVVLVGHAVKRLGVSRLAISCGGTEGR
jgi:hypothetical protein